MLSVVICSVHEALLAQMKESIASTVGVPYELLVLDNRHTGKGLCQVYNELAAQASFPYICFVHEDILFKTNNWGRLLTALFERKPALGLIGVAGTRYKSRAYSGWYSGIPALDRYNIFHRTNGTDHGMRSPANGDGDIHEVVCIDGVFMFCRKTVWEAVKFDDRLLKGFHLYDIDFSLRAAKITGVAVTVDVDIVHITQGGDFNNAWMEETMHYHRTKGPELPAFVEGADMAGVEERIIKNWLDRLKVQDISCKLKMRWIVDQGLHKKPGVWYGALKFLLYGPLRLEKIHQLLRRRPGSK